ncbi:Os06g0660450 [Oryza sativa Japonica Group]|uniref:Os06g0660450 protein n=1 Tax=Oryza sativa subsp. japonica TaxID=39947 RepID=A0A0P0WZL4_ORYSJ|nr:hypothetical protein DAI22_06g240500 [Oryza sativa Japonica Group]BAS98973.1 Os06g0660450 [Oryza sativa Japonica Group]
MCAHLPAVRRSSARLPALLFVHCSSAHLLMLLSVRCSLLAAPPLHQIWLTEGDDGGRRLKMGAQWEEEEGRDSTVDPLSSSPRPPLSSSPSSFLPPHH